MADTVYEVAESFVIEVGGNPIAYRKGEVIDPADPVVKSHASLLKPFTYPHPVKRAEMVEKATAAPGERRQR